MFISQKIAADPKFIKKSQDMNNSGVALYRAKILNAIKFIMPKEILSSNLLSTSCFKPYYDKNGKLKNEEAQTVLAQKQKQIVKTFARLPYDSIVLENDEMLVYMEKTKSGYKYNTMGIEGNILPFELFYDESTVSTLINRYYAPGFNNEMMKSLQPDVLERIKGYDEMAQIFSKLINNAIVYLNASNINKIAYKPSNKELGSIPKVIKQKFEYKVLDLYRERTSFESLEDIDSFINSGNNPSQRRAHFVRGHFKNKGGILYWWNPFMRCRDNLEKIGVIKKDYLVH